MSLVVWSRLCDPFVFQNFREVSHRPPSFLDTYSLSVSSLECKALGIVMDFFYKWVSVDMKVGLTAALDKRGFVCVWRAGQ